MKEEEEEGLGSLEEMEEEWREIMEGEESLKEKKQMRFGGQRRNKAPKEEMKQEE